jgi:L-ascorbate metabolism protein UlaG (beta-lactamase superfamily)
MRLTKYAHACVRVERDGAVLVIDPGSFTEPAALDGANAVLITHEHPDHLDVAKLGDAFTRQRDLTVYTNPDVAAQLADLGGLVQSVNSGEGFEAAGFQVRAYGGLHAEVHPEIPRVANLGFLVEESIYHPGDSFDLPTGAQVQTLFVPISGPFLKLADSVEFIRAVAPRRAYALHDFLLSEAGGKIYDRNLERLANCDYAHLEPGTTVDA